MPLHHHRSGSGPPLLLVHGIGMSHRAWTDVVPLLAGDHECYAVDLPGFGDSSPLAEPATMAALSRACREFMAEQGHRRFHVAGNSLGGGIALWLALSGTARSACGLSPVGFAAGWDRAFLHLSLMATRCTGPAMLRIVPVAGRAPVARRALLGQYVLHGERLSVHEVTASFEDLVRSTGFADARRHAVNWRCPPASRTPCPVTIAWGERDRLLLRHRQSPRARQRLPGAEHSVVHGCGHLPSLDDPEQTAAVVRAAVARG